MGVKLITPLAISWSSPLSWVTSESQKIPACVPDRGNAHLLSNRHGSPRGPIIPSDSPIYYLLCRRPIRDDSCYRGG